MYEFNSEANLIIHGCMAVIVIGVFYNLMVTTKAYGGIIGKAIRLIGIATLFITITALERVLVNFSILEPGFWYQVMQDIVTLLGLIFLGMGFSKLASATKQ